MNLDKHLKERGLDVDKYPTTVQVGIDELTKEPCVLFMLYDATGKLQGFQRYLPTAGKLRQGGDPRKARYFTRMFERRRSLCAWGFENIDPSNPDLFITEGVFDAVSLHNLGHNAIAVLANNPLPMSNWLNTMHYRTIAVCDGDGAGSKLANVTDSAIYLPEGEDCNSMDSASLQEIIEEFYG